MRASERHSVWAASVATLNIFLSNAPGIIKHPLACTRSTTFVISLPFCQLLIFFLHFLFQRHLEQIQLTYKNPNIKIFIFKILKILKLENLQLFSFFFTCFLNFVSRFLQENFYLRRMKNRWNTTFLQILVLFSFLT